MNRLDRYVARIGLGAFGACLLFFLFLMVVVDLLTNLPKYARIAEEKDLGGLEMAMQLGPFYLRQLPVLFTAVTPFATVIASMFTVARLHNANEIVPMLFVGRSIFTVLRPLLWIGVLAGVLMAACWQWVLPVVSPSLAQQEKFLEEGREEEKYLVHELHGDISQYFYVVRYEPKKQRITDLSLLVVGTLAKDTVGVRADHAVWDEQRGDWHLEGGVRTVRVDNQLIDEPVEWLGRPDLAPAVLLLQSREDVSPETMSYTELVELSEARNRADLRLALHRHITYPLANLLLLLLALPMAVRYERGSRIDRILAAIGLCGGYLLCDLTCQRLGQRGDLLHPVVAAWTPTILFGSLGFVLYGSTRT